MAPDDASGAPPPETSEISSLGSFQLPTAGAASAEGVNSADGSVKDAGVLTLPNVSQERREQRRDAFTFSVAMTLVLAFVLILGWIVCVWTIRAAAITIDDVVKLLTTVSGIMAGLVGAVAGYYFRVKEEERQR